MEKEETERRRESELSFRWRFLFFRGMLQKRRDMECFGRNIVLLWEC